jgi:hypothetical protein
MNIKKTNPKQTMDMTTRNKVQLMEALMDNSNIEGKEKADIVDQWEITAITRNEEGHCTCGHYLRRSIIIKNKETKKEMMIGCSCAGIIWNESASLFNRVDSLLRRQNKHMGDNKYCQECYFKICKCEMMDTVSMCRYCGHFMENRRTYDHIITHHPGRFIMPFGKWAGDELINIPPSYLRWCFRTFNKYQYDYILDVIGVYLESIDNTDKIG